jgi:hypothetical protein
LRDAIRFIGKEPKLLLGDILILLGTLEILFDNKWNLVDGVQLALMVLSDYT